MTTHETPIQPVPARGSRAIAALVVLLAATGLLVWQPWTGAEGGFGPPATPSPAEPSPTPAAEVFIPTAPPYVSPRALTMLPLGSLVAAPPYDAFRPRWSIVGVSDIPDGEPRVLQLPVVTTSGFVEGRSPAEVCVLGRLRTAIVVQLPARRYRLIGIAAPASGVAGPTELTRVDRVALTAYEVPVRVPDGVTPRAAIRVFATSTLGPWDEGAYRFLTEDGTGRPHFLYACVVSPTQLDGT